jgi:hypothetical protein
VGHTLPWGSRARASADRELAWAASRLFCCCPHPRWPPDGAMRGALRPAAPEAQPAPTSPSGSPAEPVVAPTPKGCPATPPPRTCSPPIGRFSPATPDSPLPATLSRPLPLHGPMYHLQARLGRRLAKCGANGGGRQRRRRQQHAVRRAAPPSCSLFPCLLVRPLPHYVSLMLVPFLPAPFPPLTGLPLAAFAFAVLACLPVPLS